MAQTGLTLPAYAKINLFLHILGQRTDGYHNLQTIFQFVDLKDSLTFHTSEKPGIEITSNVTISNLKDNLIYKAAKSLLPYTQKLTGIHIAVEKNIPMGAGLGGGSSNAATTLIALNHLWHCQRTTNQLKEIGINLGADVPIFIHGKTAWAEGIGEQLQDFNYPEQYALLIFPKLHNTTAKLFSHPLLKKDCIKLNPEQFSFETTSNVFEHILKKEHSNLAELIDSLSQHTPTRLTGTGSCIYCLNENKETLLSLQKKLDKDLDTLVTKTVNSAPVN